MNINSIRQKIWLEVGQRQDGSLPNSIFNRFFAYTIFFSIFLAVVMTALSQESLLATITNKVETFVGILFLVEYIIRAWVSPLSQRYGKGIQGICRFLLSPSALIDLIAITPLFLGLIGSEIYLIRIIRLARILRLGKVEKFQKAFTHISYAISSRLEELKITGLITGVLILISSALLYATEGDAQPDAFGSIPKAMWWSVITITTVGYGDVHPITTLGKIITALTALTGIGVIAISAGLIASGFNEAISKSNSINKSVDQKDRSL